MTTKAQKLPSMQNSPVPPLSLMTSRYDLSVSYNGVFCLVRVYPGLSRTHDPLLIACWKLGLEHSQIWSQHDHLETTKVLSRLSKFVLFVLVLYIPVNNFSVMLEHFLVFLCCTITTKHMIKCIAQEHNKMPLVSLKLATVWSY